MDALLEMDSNSGSEKIKGFPSAPAAPGNARLKNGVLPPGPLRLSVSGKTRGKSAALSPVGKIRPPAENQPNQPAEISTSEKSKKIALTENSGSFGRKERISSNKPSDTPLPVKKTKEFSLIGDGGSLRLKSGASSGAPSDASLSQNSAAQTYSWFFDSKRTRQELFLMPVYFRSRIYESNWGIRFFTFPAEKHGFYGSLSVLNKFFEPYFKLKSLYRREYPRNWRLHFQAEYSNYFEPWYGEGMKTAAQNRKDLHAHRLRVDQSFKFTNSYRIFYEPGVSWIVRREIPRLQNEKKYFKDENLLFFTGTLGYDSRDSWESAKKGQYHQVSLSCASGPKGACRTEADLRFYFSPHKRVSLAFRGFAGTAFFNPLGYSLSYKLGGPKVFRGFTENRFRGDKIYFAQSELRADLWRELISGVLFFETGEVSGFEKRWTAPRQSYGAGLRFGMPPAYKIKLRLDWGFSDNGEYNVTVDFHQSF